MTNIKPVIIIEPQTPQEFEAYYLIRYNTLRKPWNQPPGSEMDDQENSSIHAMAIDENKNVIGVCRLQMNSKDTAQLRFMGVIEQARGKHVGNQLISYLENKAAAMGAKECILQSRENAVEFYKKCGYKIVEKSFLMWGEIQHYLMKKEF